MELAEIRNALNREAPRAVRRVLPRGFIEQHIRHHLLEMQTMMQSFHAILTFPTSGRNLPQLVMKKMHKQFKLDLSNNREKINTEVEELAASVKKKRVLQTYIMLDLISATPFPFCLLNDIIYNPVDNRSPNSRLYIPGYVVLWAQRERKDQPIKVWAQLEPKDPNDMKKVPLIELKSHPELVRLPSGVAEFYAHKTVISAALYSEPDEDEAFLAGKSVEQMRAEQQQLRQSLLRQHQQQGDFLHIVWTAHEKKEIDFQEFSFNATPSGPSF